LRCFGEGEDGAAEVEGVGEVVDAFDVGSHVGGGQGCDQDGAVDQKDKEQSPAAEDGGGEACVLVEEHEGSGGEEDCGGEIADEELGGNEWGHG